MYDFGVKGAPALSDRFLPVWTGHFKVDLRRGLISPKPEAARSDRFLPVWTGHFKVDLFSPRPIQTAFYRSEWAVLKSIPAEALSAQNRKRPVQTAFYRSERAILKSISSTV